MSTKALKKLLTKEQLSKEVTMRNYLLEAIIDLVESIDEVLFIHVVNDGPGVTRLSDKTIQNLTFMKADFETDLENNI